MRRFLLSFMMNMLVPGAGLILCGRPWLGLALAVWFGVSAELAVLGYMIAPAVIPSSLRLTAAGLAGAAWLAAQGLLAGRIRTLRDPNLATEVTGLCAMAEEALDRGDLAAATSALRAALSLDDSAVLSHVLWARVCVAHGSRARTRRAWRRAARVDVDGHFRQEIDAGLRESGSRG